MRTTRRNDPTYPALKVRSDVSVQARLLASPVADLDRIDVDSANSLLVEWKHKLGPCERPFHQEAWAWWVAGRPEAVAVSASIISDHVAGKWPGGDPARFERGEVVELARLAALPGSGWARVMIRCWRALCAQAWPCWPVTAAASYSHNAMHRGDLYRFDGWTRIAENCGSSGGGTWSSPRAATDAVHGKKSLWVWSYAA